MKREKWKRIVCGALSVIMAVLVIPFTVGAESYVAKLGDINRDGVINPMDATMLLRHLARWKNIEYYQDGADVYTDGQVNNKDATTLLRYFAGWDIDLGQNEITEMDVIKDGVTDYVIVYKHHLLEDDYRYSEYDMEGDAARVLQAHFINDLGVQIERHNQRNDDTSGYTKKIIVGWTDYEDEGMYSIDREGLGDEGFVCQVVDGNIVLCGGGDEGTYQAVMYFIDMFLMPATLADREAGTPVNFSMDDSFYYDHDGRPSIGELTIAENPIADYCIVTDKDGLIVESTAAESLQHYLYRATGAMLPIYDDNDAESAKHAHEIIVGETNREDNGAYTVDREALKNDGYSLQVKDGDLIIAGGGRRGTMYGVYSFLEDYLGYRWFIRYTSYVYPAEHIDIPADLSVEFSPIFYASRTSTFVSVFDDWGDGFNAHNKITRDEELPAYGGREEELHDSIGGHSFSRLYPRKSELSDEENDAQRRGSDMQPCLTDEAVFQEMFANVKASVEINYPADLQYSVSQNDNSNWCYCENCIMSNKKYGGVSGTLIHFVNRFAEALEKEYPDIRIHTFAYQNTETPPVSGGKVKIVANDHVMVQYCPMSMCASHPITMECERNGKRYKKSLENWAKVCKTISIWDYTANYSDHLVVFPNFGWIYDNVNYYAQNNVHSAFIQGENNIRNQCEFAQLKAYLISKVLWDPEMSRERYYQYMDEFLAYFYGDAAPYIREYIDFVEEHADAHCYGCYSQPEEIMSFDGKQDYINDLWDRAEAAVQGDYFHAYHVGRSRVSTRYMLQCTTHESLFVNGTEEQKQKYREDSSALVDGLIKYGVRQEWYRELADLDVNPSRWP